MRAINLPIDAQRLVLPFAGTIRPVNKWIDGKSSDEQEKDAAGHFLWEVDVVVRVPQFGGKDKAETVAVRVPSPTEPKLTDWQPVPFERLEMACYLSKGDMRVNLTAAGIAAAGRGQSSGESKAA